MARVLPLCLWYHWDHLDFDRLAPRVRRNREKYALGLFLELTTILTGDRRFARAAAPLRDRRFRRTRDFFTDSVSTRARAHAERNTPAVARRWGFRMNMDVETFRALFEKFADAPRIKATPRLKAT